jgi:hypothetical protein
MRSQSDAPWLALLVSSPLALSKTLVNKINHLGLKIQTTADEFVEFATLVFVAPNALTQCADATNSHAHRAAHPLARCPNIPSARAPKPTAHPPRASAALSASTRCGSPVPTSGARSRTPSHRATSAHFHAVGPPRRPKADVWGTRRAQRAGRQCRSCPRGTPQRSEAEIEHGHGHGDAYGGLEFRDRPYSARIEPCLPAISASTGTSAPRSSTAVRGTMNPVVISGPEALRS